MGLIPDDVINQVLERSSIAEVIGSYVPLKRAGRNFKANCPFHQEKTPSFVVNPDKQIYHCFGCGVGGNVINFVMQQERLEFPEALRLLAQKAGITVPEADRATVATGNLKQQLYKVNELAASFFHQNLLAGQSQAVRNARDYVKGRKLSLELVKQANLGYAPEEWDALINFLRKKDISLGLMEKAGLIVVRENKEGFYDRFRHRVIFPIQDSRGQYVAFGARALKESESAKYINSPETALYTKGQHLYGLHLAKDGITRRDCAIVVEGYMDFLIPFQAGVDNIVASQGTALTVDQIRLLRRYTHNIVMLFDSDAAGEAAMLRSLDLLIEEDMNVKVASLTAGDDPDSFVQKSGAAALWERVEQAQTLFDYKVSRLMAKHDAKSIEGRAKIAGEMLPTINRFRNEVLKFGYVKRLAGLLGLPEEPLLKELSKQRPAVSAALNAQAQPKPSMPVAARTVESNILRLMLQEEELIAVTKEELTKEDFHDENIRQVVVTIFDLFENGKEVSVPNLMNCFPDQGIQRMISALMAAEENIVGDIKRVHRDCVNRVKSDRLKLRRQDLRQRITQAESAGDNSTRDELMEEFNQLIKMKG